MNANEVCDVCGRAVTFDSATRTFPDLTRTWYRGIDSVVLSAPHSDRVVRRRVAPAVLHLIISECGRTTTERSNRAAQSPRGVFGPIDGEAGRHVRAVVSVADRGSDAGVLCSLDVLWVNYPSREADALKPRQLDVARRCGLRVPQSLITNRTDAVRDFAAGVEGPLAGKNLSAASLVEAGHIQTAYTRRLGPGDLTDLSGVEATAHLFQEFIEDKAFEVRVTVVGERVFAAAIHAHSEPARIDFRTDYDNLSYSVVELPATVLDGMRGFLRAFDLSFGAFDFAVTSAGDWVLFECNPFGQYGWLEDALDLPITAAIADPRGRSHLVTFIPTDLTDHEQHRARQRLVELGEQLTEKGSLRTSAWRAVFERTWRHPYVPGFYPDKDIAPVMCIGDRREEWLDTVYSDTTLITKVMAVPLSRSLRPATGSMFTSSSTLPSLVMSMLEELDVVDGHRVLEIGTGTGYNAALLCERLGSSNVTSVDIDPELVDLAGERLAANGYTPALAAVDGDGGYPTGAPYDRIIATCAVPAIPTAWLAQSTAGTVIHTDVHGAFGGTLVKLLVDEDGTATGRFVPYWTGFMDMRHTASPADRHWTRRALDLSESWTSVDPMTVHVNGAFGFVVQWFLPGVAQVQTTDNDGRQAIFLIDRDGNRAEVVTTEAPQGYRVRQYGERRLWDRVEEAAAFWNAEGRPSYERFGIRATVEDQYVWYDDPDGAHRWPLTVVQAAGS